jgi:hypothetical protein
MKPAPLEIDFVAAPRRPLWPGALLLLVALAGTVQLQLRYREIQRELAALQTAQGLLSPRSVPAAGARPEAELKSADAALRQLSLPWGDFVAAVEAAAGDDVALLLLQPDAVQRVLRVNAEARSADAMFAYLRRLGDAAVLADVHLVGHQIQLDDPRKPVQFSVQAALRVTP